MPNDFFAITTGDSNGIGLEVTAKALLSLQKSTPAFFRKNTFFIFVQESVQLSKAVRTSSQKYMDLLAKKFDLYFLTEDFFLSLSHGKKFSSSQRFSFFHKLPPSYKKNVNQKHILFIVSCESSPPHWVRFVGEKCLNSFFSGMITGPLSKPLIQDAGFGEVGHTEILQTVCEKKFKKKFFPFMTFLGTEFNVALATGHLPLKNVSKKLNPKLVSHLLTVLKKFNLKVKDKRPIAILGLNPHAGDNGIIGKEEVRWLNSFCVKKNRSLPMVPDAAFLPHQRKRFSFYLCLYHDQGLIPFKTIHGTHGAHLTLGLPLLRTSVDHGTAFDLFGQNRADSSSMELAIKSAINMLSEEARHA